MRCHEHWVITKFLAVEAEEDLMDGALHFMSRCHHDAESVVHPSSKMRCLDLFSGIGGQALALKAAGVKTIGYCEIDKRNAEILRHTYHVPPNQRNGWELFA